MTYEWIYVMSAALLAVGVIAATLARRPPDRHERLLLVGVSPMTANLVAEIEARPELCWRVLGVVADVPGHAAPEVGPWLGPVTTLSTVIAETHPTRIVITPADRRKAAVEEPLIDARLRGIAVEDTIRTLERATGKLPIEQMSSRSLLLGDGFRHSDFVRADTTLIVTRVLSVGAAVVGLAVLAPLLGLVALAIAIDSRGPVLFVQERMGMGGRPFGLLKFRTMRNTPVRASEWVRDNEHRITRVGKWLRRFRMDELPQLVNVLRGQMNLVGPRPHPVSNYETFMDRIPHYRLRAAVRPGITGWAQIRYGYANGLEEETEKMRYDLYYIKHRSFWFDMSILFATFAVLLFDNRNHESVRQRPSGAAWTGRWQDTSGVALR